MTIESTSIAKTLAQSLRLPCGLVLSNRIVKAATTEHFADTDGNPTRDHCRLYARWAAGGAGLLITGNVSIDEAHLEGPGNVFISDRTPLPPFEAWATAVGPWNTPLILQLVHPGALATTPHPVSPSGVWLEQMQGRFARPRVLEAEEIPLIITKFARAAAFARTAGFAGIQIHAAHGFLLNQFLSARTNLRADEWGRTSAGRRRLLLEVVRECRTALGSDRVLAIKINTSDYVEGGFDIDESLEALSALDNEGVDFIELSGGSYEKTAMWGAENEAKMDQSTEPEGHFLPYARRARQFLTRSALMVTGGFRTAVALKKALSFDCTNLIGLARALIVDPDLPHRWLKGDIGTRVSWPKPRGTVFDQLAWFQNRMQELAR